MSHLSVRTDINDGHGVIGLCWHDIEATVVVSGVDDGSTEIGIEWESGPDQGVQVILNVEEARRLATLLTTAVITHTLITTNDDDGIPDWLREPFESGIPPFTEQPWTARPAGPEETF